jgi:hypothetical protein
LGGGFLGGALTGAAAGTATGVPLLGTAAGALAGAGTGFMYDWLNPTEKMVDTMTSLAPERRRALQTKLRAIQKAVPQRGAFANTFHQRVVVPKAYLPEQDLSDLGFLPVQIAIPEAGQDSMTSYRHPQHNYHLHPHGDVWTVHNDSHPSISMLKYHRKGVIDKIKDLGKGMTHIVGEGVPGAYAYVRNALTRGWGQADDVSPMVKSVIQENPRAVVGRRFLPTSLRQLAWQAYRAKRMPPVVKTAIDGAGVGTGEDGMSATVPRPVDFGDGGTAAGRENQPQQDALAVHMQPPDPNIFSIDQLMNGDEPRTALTPAQDDSGVAYGASNRPHPSVMPNTSDMTSSAYGAGGRTAMPTGAGIPAEGTQSPMSNPDTPKKSPMQETMEPDMALDSTTGDTPQVQQLSP